MESGPRLVLVVRVPGCGRKDGDESGTGGKDRRSVRVRPFWEKRDRETVDLFGRPCKDFRHLETLDQKGKTGDGLLNY